MHSKPDSSQRCLRSLQCYSYGHKQSEYATNTSSGKGRKGSSTPVSQSSQKKTCAMVVQSCEDGEEPLMTGQCTVEFAMPRVMMVRPTLGYASEDIMRHRLYRDDRG